MLLLDQGRHYTSRLNFYNYTLKIVLCQRICVLEFTVRIDRSEFLRYDVGAWKRITQTENYMKPYEYLEHTADMGLLVQGKDLSGLLKNAAQGLFETVAVVDTIDETVSIEIHLTAESVEELFVAWLDELIFRHETEEIFFKRAVIHACSETEMSAAVYGEPVNFAKHAVYTEIKSVTYHQLEVLQKSDGSWGAQVIFDL